MTPTGTLALALGAAGAAVASALYLHNRSSTSVATPAAGVDEARLAEGIARVRPEPGAENMAASSKPKAWHPRLYPMPRLPDGRKPRITSHHHARNPSRPTHNGVDLFYPVMPGDPDWKRGDGGGTTNGKWIVPPGTPAIAVDSGRVHKAGKISTGWRVWIDHGDYRSGYFHLEDLYVRKGDTVTAGQQLGVIGDNPAAHDARHLHFEISPTRHHNPLDPAPFLASARFLALPDTTGPIRTIDRITASAA